MGIGFDAYQLHSGRIERDIGPGSAANFERPAETEARGEPAIWSNARLDAGVEKIVPGGE